MREISSDRSDVWDRAHLTDRSRPVERIQTRSRMLWNSLAPNNWRRDDYFSSLRMSECRAVEPRFDRFKKGIRERNGRKFSRT